MIIEQIKQHCLKYGHDAFEIETDICAIPSGSIVIHPDQKLTSLNLNKIDMGRIDFEFNCYLTIDKWDTFINLNGFVMFDLNEFNTNYENEEHYFLIVKDLKLTVEVPTFKNPITFNIRDKVKIVQRVEKESGWLNQWVPKMDDFVNDGKEYTIVNISNKGIQLKDTAYNWPSTALKLLNEVKSSRFKFQIPFL